jgi:hypothetical protein
MLHGPCRCIIICKVALGVHDKDVKCIHDNFSITETCESNNTCGQDCILTCKVDKSKSKVFLVLNQLSTTP